MRWLARDTPPTITRTTGTVSNSNNYNNINNNYRYRLLPRPGQLWQCNLPVNHLTNFIFCLAKLGIIVTYFYICDRTNFFMKENKYFTPINFWLPVLYITVRNYS